MSIFSSIWGLFSRKHKLKAEIDRLTGDIAAIDRAVAKGRGDAPALLTKRSALLAQRALLVAELAALG